jgi:Pyruvate/2-oxoacid:ferredoxin oxidoreductase delta subunit
LKPYLSDRRCPAQQSMCTLFAACPQEAVAYVADEAAPLGGRITFDHERCDGCGKCVEACCGHAVEMR